MTRSRSKDVALTAFLSTEDDFREVLEILRERRTVEILDREFGVLCDGLRRLAEHERQAAFEVLAAIVRRKMDGRGYERLAIDRVLSAFFRRLKRTIHEDAQVSFEALIVEAEREYCALIEDARRRACEGTDTGALSRGLVRLGSGSGMVIADLAALASAAATGPGSPPAGMLATIFSGLIYIVDGLGLVSDLSN